VGTVTVVTEPALSPAQGKQKWYLHNELGQLVWVAEPDPDNPGQMKETARYTFDKMGRLTNPTGWQPAMGGNEQHCARGGPLLANHDQPTTLVHEALHIATGFLHPDLQDLLNTGGMPVSDWIRNECTSKK
jgi:hypothetical protein